MSDIRIHGFERSVEKIFNSDYIFEIPLYQRPYSWETEQTGELFFDLTNAMAEAGTPVENLNPYFLGTIVLIKKENAPYSKIIDGQQRLTTLAILLSVIRELLPENQARYITPFLYEEGNLISGAPTTYRLSLRDRDQEFFKKYIYENGGIQKLENLNSANLTDSQNKIRENTQLLKDQLSKMPENEQIRLAQFIIRQCLFVVVTTPDIDSAYKIFSVLNNRGLDLSHADILKAELVGTANPNMQKGLAKIWDDTEELLGREEFGKLFGHVRTIYQKNKPKETILKEFRDHVISQFDSSEDIIKNILIPYSGAYYEVINECYENSKYSDEINNYFYWLIRIDNHDWVPSALSYIVKHRSEPEKLRDFFRNLERLAGGMMILRYNINQRYERYAKILNYIEKSENIFAINSPLHLRSDERSGILNVLDGDVYLNKKIRLYVLLRIDASFSEGLARYSYPLITVEHVLPQTPRYDSEWVKWFADEETRRQYVHRLGNLVLLSRQKNSAARNYEFEVKKKKYFRSKDGISPFVLTTQVLSRSTWTPSDIEERQEELLTKAKEIWDL